MKKFLLNIMLAFALLVTQVPHALAEEPTAPTITASGSEASQFGPNNAFDGNMSTRWASEVGQNKDHWIQIEYNETKEVGTVVIAWERTTINHLVLEGLVGEDWVEIYSRTTNPNEFDERIVLDQLYELKGLRATIKEFDAKGPDRDGKEVTWATVSIMELTTEKDRYDLEVAEGNIFLNKSVEVSEFENNDFVGSNLVDGDSTTRWATVQDPETPSATIPLGKVYSIQSFKLLWDERIIKNTGTIDPNIESYKIEYSIDGENWKVAYTRDEYLPIVSETVNLDAPIHAQYIKITILKSRAGEMRWNNVSMREFEAYSNLSDPDEMTSLEDVKSLSLSEDGTKVVLPEIVGSDSVVVSGTDSPGVINHDGNVTKPLQTKEVEVSLTSTKKGVEETKAFKITVEGQFENAGTGQKPVITPNIQEWYGTGETLNISSYSLDFTNAPEFKKLDKIYTQDLKDYGKSVGGEASTPIIFEKVDFGNGADEVYIIEINEDSIVVKAQAYVGALHATRTLLQVDDKNLSTGIIRDYPSFGMRSFMLDTGRKFVPYDEVVELMKNLAFYKYNDFQLHLNDNYIFLSEHKKGNDFANNQEYLDYVLENAETGFRLDVSTENKDTGVRLTSDDHYTKEEFRSLVTLSQDLGILLVPELDTPGHALSFVRVRPDLMYQGDVGGKDISERVAMLDLDNPQTLPFIKSVYDELFNDLFKDLPVIHIGSDEYYGGSESYRKYLDDMIGYTQENGKTPRVWGSLGYKTGTTPVRSKDVQLDIWNLGWNPINLAIKDGFDFINILDITNYIVPSGNGGRGGYGDFLHNPTVYNNWAPNIFDGTTIPASHPNLVGGSYALWNDNVDLHDTGITSHDMMVRTYDSLPYFSEKMWGTKTGLTYDQFNATNIKNYKNAPGTNPFSDQGFEDEVLEITDVEKDYSTGFEEISYRQKGDKLIIDMTLNLKSDKKNQVIASGPRSTIYAVDEDGYFAYQFENYHIQFDVKLPVDEYVNVQMVLENQNTTVVVNGKEVKRIEHPKYKKLTLTSFVAPLETLNVSIDGTLDIFDVYYGEYEQQIDPARITLDDIKSVTSNSEELGQSAADNGEITKAFDNNINTLWHTKWNKSVAYPHTVDIKLNEKETLSEFTYVPRQGGGTNGIITEYEVEFYNDGEVVYKTKGTWKADSANKVIKLDAASRDAKSGDDLVVDAIKFSSLKGEGGYSSAAEFLIKRAVDESSIKTDKIELNNKIKEAKAYNADDYTVESYEALQVAIREALYVVTNAKDQAEIDAAISALNAAIDSLVSIDGPAIPEETVDTKKLQAAITEAKAFKESDYTADSYKALQTAITAAEKAMTAKTQAEVDAATDALNAAIKALVKVDEPEIPEETVDTKNLLSTITEAKTYKKSQYTADSYQKLQTAITAAEKAMTAKTQAEVDAATEALNAAIKALVEVDEPEVPEETLNTKALQEAIKNAKSYKEVDYTADSYKALQEAIVAAEKAVTATTQTEIDAATVALNEAIEALVKTIPVPGDGGTNKPGDKPGTGDGGTNKPGDKPGTGDGGTNKPGDKPDTGEETPKPEDKTPEGDKLPTTGMGVNFVPYIFVALAGVFFAISRKYKKEN